MSEGYNQFFKKVKKNKKIQASPPLTKRAEKKADTPSAEEVLRHALRMKKIKKKSKPADFPHLLVFASVLFLSISLIGYAFPGHIMSAWDRIQFQAFSSAGAQQTQGPAVNSTTKGEKEANTSANANMSERAQCADVPSWTSEDISHFSKLNERKYQLDLREKELNTLESELHKQKSELEARLQRLEQVRVEIATTLQERVDLDQERINTLVEVYSSMKPRQAADVFEKLNEDLAVEILGKMKKKSAADILNLLDPAKARALSEKFTGYQRR